MYDIVWQKQKYNKSLKKNPWVDWNLLFCKVEFVCILLQIKNEAGHVLRRLF